jgi:thiamine-phosphate pyrophosphorylase
VNQLYVLCDWETITKYNTTLQTIISLTIKHDAKLLQYRNKTFNTNQKIEHLTELRKALDIPIIVNDAIDLIKYADGLHLGQEDMAKIDPDKEIAIDKIRAKIGQKLLGLSTHNEAEINEANHLNLDYIGLGAYRPTSTKKVNNELGEMISSLALLSRHRVGAIGGVRLDDEISNVTYNVVGSDLIING